MPNKPKLFFIINRLVIGGQSLDTIPLANYLRDDYEVLILYGEKEKDEQEATFLLQRYPSLQIKKISSLKRTVNPVYDVIAFFVLLKLLRTFKPQIVHTHGAKSGLLGRFSAKLAGVPCIFHTYHGHVFHSYYNKYISIAIQKTEKWLGEISTKIITLSAQQKFEIVNLYKVIPEKKVCVISLGADINFFLSDKEIKRKNFRKKYNLNDDDIAIGIIGRIVPVKNHFLFLKIAEQLQNKNERKIIFFIIGDGELKTSLQTYLNNKNISWSASPDNNASVIFTSWLTEITEPLHGLDIVLLTSLNEGTPLSLIEAQICAKPVVAANVGGVKDTFIDNETGFLINGHAAGNYAEKLELLINDKNLRISMGEKGNIFATQRFSKQREIDAFKTLYKCCLSSATNK
ncbi:MAG: glycosyltransferase [Chitinophagaceae bacterium]